MDIDTCRHLLNALRQCGQFTPEQLVAAESILAAPNDDAAIADQLLSARLVTPYMYRKIKGERTFEILFGPYLILDKVGEGGMGKVYRAVQFPLGRMVALKVVRQHLMNNKTVRRRYKKEAAAAASLDHPNIVKLFDADDFNGRYYLAMEYVDGIDLSRMLKEFGTPPTIGLQHYQEAVEYVRQSALGLQHAHDKGFVHRDVKPSNLLVYGERALPGTSGKAVVKVLDMGLVRSLTDDDDDNTELTRDGTVVGTPDYMSPEQAKNSSTVDHRADIYSLGCTLYYLLRGRSPYPDGSPIDKLLRHQLDPIPDLRTERPDLPARLCEVVRKLMEKRPGDRYQTCTAVAEALAPFTGLGVPIHEPFNFSGEPANHGLDANAFTTRGVHASIGRIPDGPTAVLPKTAATATATPAPPAAPAIKLRVVQPKPAAAAAVPVRVATEARALPTAIPNADASPSSDSLPGTSAARTPMRTPTRTPTRDLSKSESEADTRASPRRKPRPPGLPVKRAAVPRWVIGVGIGAIALIVLVVAAVALLSSTTTQATTTSSEVKSTNGASLGVATVPPQPVVPIFERLPDRTSGLVILHPQAFFKTIEYSPQGDGGRRLAAHLRELSTRSFLDPRRCTRGLIAITEPKSEVVTIVEGPFLTPSWIDSLAATPRVSTTMIGPDRLLSFPTKLGPKHGLVIGSDAYAIAGKANVLRELSQRMQDKRPAKGVDPVIALERPEAGTLLFDFRAGPSLTTPDGESLGSLGIRAVSLQIKLEGVEFNYRLVVRAASKTKLDDFISLTLTTKLGESMPAAKPFLDLLANAEVTQSTSNGEAVLTAVARMPWQTTLDALEKLLPPIDDK